jgi:hypothetical protein
MKEWQSMTERYYFGDGCRFWGDFCNYRVSLRYHCDEIISTQVAQSAGVAAVGARV